MKEEARSEQEKEDEHKDWPKCVFYHDIKCPVRKEMAATTLGDMLKPFAKPQTKFDDRQAAMEIGKDMMEGVFKAAGMTWSFLAAFCHICPLKFKKDHESLQVPQVREVPQEMRRPQ